MGSKAMYIGASRRSKQKRYELLTRIGLEKIFEKPCKLDRNFINREKENLLQFIKENI